MDKKEEFKRIKKSKQFRKDYKKIQSQYDSFKLTSDDIKSNIKSDIEKRIDDNTDKLKELNNNKEISLEEKNKKKKYLKNKIRKLKNNLNSEDNLNFLLNMKKRSLRKLKNVCKKLETINDKEKLKKVTCFRCRKNGHTINDCKTKLEDLNIDNFNNNTDLFNNSQKSEICFNCGKNDHTVHQCDKEVDYSNMPYALCFVCKENGHLSSACPKSDKGIYVNGGSCYVCNSNKHLAKNCPDKKLEVKNIEKKVLNNKVMQINEVPKSNNASNKKLKGFKKTNSKTISTQNKI